MYYHANMFIGFSLAWGFTLSCVRSMTSTKNFRSHWLLFHIFMVLISCCFIPKNIIISSYVILSVCYKRLIKFKCGMEKPYVLPKLRRSKYFVSLLIFEYLWGWTVTCTFLLICKNSCNSWNKYDMKIKLTSAYKN